MTRTLRCPHCGAAHDARLTVCPVSQKPLNQPPAAGTAAGEKLVVPRPPFQSEPEFGGVTRRGPAPKAAVARSGGRRELIGKIIDGKYKINSVLGEGGMGTVFEAEHVAIGRSVAVKVLHPAQASKKVAVKRFHQEARAAGGIGHPNICEVYDMGTLPDASPYLVMERLTGETLSSRIAAEGGLPFDEMIDVGMQVLAGLAAAHERGILHRDIKPENVFLVRRAGFPAVVKILDFGVSKITTSIGHSEWEEETDLTKTGMVMGTPYYMSPEQARGERNLDARVDIYATGVLLYEALTGRRPFAGSNYNSLLLQILAGNAPPMRQLRPSVPSAIEEIVARAMATKRDDRYPTAAEMQRALARVRPGHDRRSSSRTPESTQKVVAPDAMALSSIDIPIAFSETDLDESDLIPASAPVPLPDLSGDEGSPYDDDTTAATLKMDGRGLIAEAAKKK
ncbi:MAG TPA: serine/threonine-protein kinase, partial [Polyangiaceae bacterium]